MRRSLIFGSHSGLGCSGKRNSGGPPPTVSRRFRSLTAGMRSSVKGLIANAMASGGLEASAQQETLAVQVGHQRQFEQARPRIVRSKDGGLDRTPKRLQIRPKRK